MPSSISFRGRNIYLPSVVVDINNNLLASESLDAKNMCVIGHFPKLQPETAYVFRNGEGATVPELYGDDYEMMLLNKIWQNPIFDSVASAASLTYVNAGTGTLATSYLNGNHFDADNADLEAVAVGADPGANEALLKAIKLKAIHYGVVGNDVQYKSTVDSLDPENFYKLETRLGGNPASNDSGAPEQITFTPVADAIFKVWIDGGERYDRAGGANQVDSGSEIDRYLNIELYQDSYDNSGDGSAIFATQAPALLAGDVAADIAAIEAAMATDTAAALATGRIKLADYDNYDALLDAINNAVFTDAASNDVLVSNYFSAAAINYDAQPKYLDANYYQVDGSSDAKLIFNAHLYQYVKEINALADAGFYPCQAEIIGWPIILENMPAFRNLSGGTTVAPTDASYKSALAAMRTKDIQLITCLTTDVDTTKDLALHLEEVLAYSRDRQGFAGAEAGYTIDQAYALVVAPHASKHMAVINQGATIVDHNGADMELGPEYLAFLVMCMQGALPYAEPLTGKQPNISATSENFNRELDINKLIRKCQLGVHQTLDNALRIARGVSSWNKDNETINCEMSARESILGAARFLRSYLVRELGSKILDSTQGRVISLVNTRCENLKNEGIIKGYRNVDVEIVDDTAFITLDLAVVKPLNFVRFTFNIADF